LGEYHFEYPWSSYKVYASGAGDDLLDQRPLLAQFSKIPFRARKEFVEEVQGRLWERGVLGYPLSIPEIVAGVVSGLGISKESIYSENRNREGSFGRGIVGYLARRLTGHSLKSVAEHFGRDPVAISQGVGKLETRLREDENLGRRITGLAEKLAKGRKRILI
jgi:chromosomal replication initiation ATPase DnaA